MTLELRSSAISANHKLPARFTCDGARVSPPLGWSGAPENTAAFALIADDPDAPRGVFTHWVLFNIPGNVEHLDENIPQARRLDNGAIQGRNDLGGDGYGAPCPPKHDAPHHYRFTLYALDAPLRLQAGATRQQLLDALQAHVLDQAQLIGLYARRS
jgi:Raf kinase inhibitor-like YbhB/YbcL family protein